MPLAGSREVAVLVESKRKERGISVAELTRRIGADGKRLRYVLNGQREMRVDESIKLYAFFYLGLGCLIDGATVERLRSSLPFREWQHIHLRQARRPYGRRAFSSPLLPQLARSRSPAFAWPATSAFG